MLYLRKENIDIIPLGDDEDEDNDGTVFYDSESGNTIILDDIAEDIYNFFENESDPEKIAEFLFDKYDGDESEIKSHMYELIEELKNGGLLKEKENS